MQSDEYFRIFNEGFQKRENGRMHKLCTYAWYSFPKGIRKWKEERFWLQQR